MAVAVATSEDVLEEEEGWVLRGNELIHHPRRVGVLPSFFFQPRIPRTNAPADHNVRKTSPFSFSSPFSAKFREAGVVEIMLHSLAMIFSSISSSSQSSVKLWDTLS